MNKAEHFARGKHEGQFRKFTGLPYFTHCQNVANIVKCYPFENGRWDEPALCVAYLHDTLEDTDTSVEELEQIFGYDIPEHVKSLTNVPKSFGTRKERKAEDNVRLSAAHPIAQTVKLADILDNVPSMIAYKPDFGRRYLKEKLRTVKVLDAGQPYLLRTVRQTLHKLAETYNVSIT